MPNWIDDVLAGMDLPEDDTGPTLAEYVTVVKRLELDVWQVDMCNRLERAFWIANAKKFDLTLVAYGMGKPYYVAPSGIHIDAKDVDEHRDQGINAAIAAPPQHGKSCIVSQAYPSWILGYDPLHRIRLTTYNVTHSKRFSAAIRRTMQTREHKTFFPDPAGHVPSRSSAEEWSTAAREAENDGQPSFIALGLETGFTGQGVDTLIIDDPYPSAEKAMSPTIRDISWRFYTDTAFVRTEDHTNVLIMYHRYHQDDIGGRALATGDFDLWRYAAQADGDFFEEEKGRTFPCLPIGRKEGEYLTPRRSDLFYAKQKRNDPVWQAQFQGRPTSKDGNMFDVMLIEEIGVADVPYDFIAIFRAWDNAATEGAGAFTAGTLMAIAADEIVYVLDVKREQVGTAQRKTLQHETAASDGKLVQIHVPQDPGSAGKDVAFEAKQNLEKEGFNVTVTPVSGSKELRAYNWSVAVNSRMVKAVMTGNRECVECSTQRSQEITGPCLHCGSLVSRILPGWDISNWKKELRFFPGSTFKDQVDSGADAYNQLVAQFHHGLVIKSASPFTNLLHHSLFASRFGDKVPANWEVEASVRIGKDGSEPSGYAIVARAPENAQIGEAVFIIAASRRYVSDAAIILEALRRDLIRTCAKGVDHADVIWVNSEAADIAVAAGEKLDIFVTEFKDDSTAGIMETNYYFQEIPKRSVWYKDENGDGRIGTSRLHMLVDDLQYQTPIDDLGMVAPRQDLASWSYGRNGEVQTFTGVTLDCVRKCLYKFALSATSLTAQELLETRLPEAQQEAQVRAKLHTPEFVDALMARERALNLIRIEKELERQQPKPKRGDTFSSRPVQRRYRGSLYGGH